MVGAARKELELRLKVTADSTAGVKAMNDLAAATARVQAGANRASMAMGGNPIIGGPGGARLGLGGGGGGGGSFFGGLGALGKAGLAGLGIYGLQQGAQQVTGAINTLNSPFSTGAQKDRALFRSLVPFGGTIQDFGDALSGRKAAIEKGSLESQQRAAAMQGRLEGYGFDLSNRPQQAGLESRARSLNGASAILEGPMDRSSAMGEKAYRDRQKLLPLERESAKAEREAAAAAASRRAALAEMYKLERRSSELASERAKLERNLAASGAKRANQLNRLGELENEIQGVGGLRKQALSQASEAAKQEAQARAAVGGISVRRLQEEASSFEQDAAQAAGGARRLGGMNVFDRQEAIRNLELLKKFGPESLDPTQVQSALSIAPETAGKIVEKAGAGTAEFKRLQELAPADYAGDPEELRKKAQQARDEAERKSLEVERSLANATAAAGRDLATAIKDVISQVVESTKRELLNQIRIGKGG